mgnify:CR=1 FL=1
MKKFIMCFVGAMLVLSLAACTNSRKTVRISNRAYG